MPTPLIPQEVYLLERYSSLAYYKEMMDAFAALVATTEQALEQFMQNLPPDYRSRHQSMQPDIVWGERVIPNLRYALGGLRNGWIQLEAGNINGLTMTGNVNSSFAGVNRDYTIDWMAQKYYDAYCAHELIASGRASNIGHTTQGNWIWGDLAAEYHSVRGALNPPKSWPQYRLDLSVRVTTDAKVPHTGVYLPDIDNSCAQFLIEGWEAWKANVSQNAGDAEYTQEPTTWTLIKRVADSGGSRGWGDETAAPEANERIRVEGGQACPQDGYYFTPAQSNSRRRFKQGDTMPSVGGDYGMTIWQWDAKQDESIRQT
jgi:hypothetical protein